MSEILDHGLDITAMCISPKKDKIAIAQKIVIKGKKTVPQVSAISTKRKPGSKKKVVYLVQK